VEQIDPPEGQKSEDKKLPVEFWLKAWGVVVVLAGLSMFLIGTRIETILMTAGFGIALAFGKRVQAFRKIALFFSGILFLMAAVWMYFNFAVEPDTFRARYFFVLFLVYVSLYIFLLTPDVKNAFGPFPPPKPLPKLTSQQRMRIKIWVRLLAFCVAVEGLLSYILSDSYSKHGLPAEEKIGMAMGVIAGIGMLFLRQNIGRRFGLFVCLATCVGLAASNFGETVFGFWGYLYTATLLIFFAALFFFLLHPKTKAVFQVNS
jgi:hypothetical protein